jgi:hypothetical protein
VLACRPLRAGIGLLLFRVNVTTAVARPQQQHQLPPPQLLRLTSQLSPAQQLGPRPRRSGNVINCLSHQSPASATPAAPPPSSRSSAGPPRLTALTAARPSRLRRQPSSSTGPEAPHPAHSSAALRLRTHPTASPRLTATFQLPLPAGPPAPPGHQPPNFQRPFKRAAAFSAFSLPLPAGPAASPSHQPPTFHQPFNPAACLSASSVNRPPAASAVASKFEK